MGASWDQRDVTGATVLWGHNLPKALLGVAFGAFVVDDRARTAALVHDEESN